MKEIKVNIDGSEKTLHIPSLKARDAQKLWGIMKKFEGLQEDDSKSIEYSEELNRIQNDLMKEYSGLTDKELEEVTVDDLSPIKDYFIDQARKFITGFSSASLNAES